MFYSILEKLCKEQGTSPSAVCVKIGYSKATASYWKSSGKMPKREALEKLAEYFSVPVDYLLGRENEETDEPSRKDMTKAAFLGALLQKNSAPIQIDRSELFRTLADLTDEELLDLLNYAKFLLSKR